MVADGSRGPVAHVNEVRLVGRVSGPPERRQLPSGTVVMTGRLVVERVGADRARPLGRRPAGARAAGPARPGFDVLDCAAFTAGGRRSMSAWRPGDVVEVTGALRRRFWRSPTGPVSRCEVEVSGARRLARPAEPR